LWQLPTLVIIAISHLQGIHKERIERSQSPKSSLGSAIRLGEQTLPPCPSLETTHI